MNRIVDEIIKLTEENNNWEKLINLYESLIKNGDKSDLEDLLNYFLKNPFGYKKEIIIDIIMLLGDISYSELIFKKCINNNLLIENISPQVLSCLGFWQYEPVIKVCLNYIDEEVLSQNYKLFCQEKTWIANHELNQIACLALINFDLTEYKETIEQKILSCNNRHLFPEFTPSLISKINGEYNIEKFYNENKNIVSCDCFGGVILGIALSGNKKLFKEILWNSYWELAETGTGNSFWAYIGLEILNISLKEIVDEIFSKKNSLSQEEIEYRIEVLLSMISRKLDNPLIPISIIKIKISRESNKELFNLLNSKRIEFLIKDEYLKKEFFKIMELLKTKD